MKAFEHMNTTSGASLLDPATLWSRHHSKKEKKELVVSENNSIIGAINITHTKTANLVVRVVTDAKTPVTLFTNKIYQQLTN